MRCFNPAALRLSISLPHGTRCQQLHAHGRHQRARPYHHTVFVALGLAQLIWQAA
jgi:hypothetical protein